MTAALEGGEWSAARPGRTLPPGKTRYPFYRRLGGPQGRSGRAENLVPTGIYFFLKSHCSLFKHKAHTAVSDCNNDLLHFKLFSMKFDLSGKAVAFGQSRIIWTLPSSSSSFASAFAFASSSTSLSFSCYWNTKSYYTIERKIGLMLRIQNTTSNCDYTQPIRFDPGPSSP